MRANAYIDGFNLYYGALKGECQPFFCAMGRFQTKTRLLPQVGSEQVVAVRLTQEKGSDVNLAARLVSDACEGRIDAALVVTDDFDQEGAMKATREERGVGLVVASPRGRTELAEAVGADSRKKIPEPLLRECQLPRMALDHEGREIFRPPAWDPRNGEAAPKDGLLSSCSS